MEDDIVMAVERKEDKKEAKVMLPPCPDLRSTQKPLAMMRSRWERRRLEWATEELMAALHVFNLPEGEVPEVIFLYYRDQQATLPRLWQSVVWWWVDGGEAKYMQHLVDQHNSDALLLMEEGEEAEFIYDPI